MDDDLDGLEGFLGCVNVLEEEVGGKRTDGRGSSLGDHSPASTLELYPTNNVLFPAPSNLVCEKLQRRRYTRKNSSFKTGCWSFELQGKVDKSTLCLTLLGIDRKENELFASSTAHLRNKKSSRSSQEVSETPMGTSKICGVGSVRNGRSGCAEQSVRSRRGRYTYSYIPSFYQLSTASRN